MTKARWRILCGDARKLDLPDGSAHAVLTSVPYWGLRRYSDNSLEIGRENTLREWTDNLVECAREWKRVLRDDGLFFCNVGDAYAGSWGNYNPTGQGGQRSKSTERYTRPAWTDNTYRPPASYPQSGLKQKDLMGLPWRLAFALQADGWYLRSAIVWAKGLDWLPQERKAQDDIRTALAEVRVSAAGSLFGLSKELDRTIKKAERAVDRVMMSGAVMPESVRDRFSSSYEMVFMFSKSPRYFFDQEAVRIPHLAASLKRYEYGLHACTDGSGLNRAVSGAFQCERLGDFMRPGGRNPRNVWMFWRVGTSPSGTFVLSSGEEVAHFASWPQLLAERIIKCATSKAGACATCGAPFVRVIEKTGHVNRREPAHVPGNADTKTDSTGWAPTMRATDRFIPSCTCHSSPIRGSVICPKCGGSGHAKNSRSAKTGSDYEIGTTANRLALLRQTARVAGQEYDAAFEGTETSDPCPACSGEGTIPGDIWPDDILVSWPRVPCTVLDPMAGSGTTGRAALNLGRSVVLNDLNPSYCQLMRERMAAYPGDVARKKG